MRDAQPAMDPAPATPATVDTDADEDPNEVDGIDVTLIRWCLSLTPEERLDALQANLNAIVWLRDAAESAS